jgi:hypothetical protein
MKGKNGNQYNEKRKIMNVVINPKWKNNILLKLIIGL